MIHKMITKPGKWEGSPKSMENPLVHNLIVAIQTFSPKKEKTIFLTKDKNREQDTKCLNVKNEKGVCCKLIANIQEGKPWMLRENTQLSEILLGRTKKVKRKLTKHIWEDCCE